MKCKHCKLEVHYEGGYLEEEGTGSKQCFANKIKTAGQSFHGHEPAEPEVELGCPHGCTNLQVAKQCPVHVVEKVANLVADHGPRVDTRRVPFAPCEGLKDCVTKVECLTAVRCLKNLPEATTQATEARPEIHTVGFKPLMGETKDSSRCSLDGAARIPLNREGTKFGACTLVNGEDGTGGCKDPLHDYELEQKGEAAARKVEQPAVEPQKVCESCRKMHPVGRRMCDFSPEAGSTRPEMPPAIEPWPKIWGVRGKFGSNVSFFNKESAERYIAERVNPDGFLMTEYVPLAASVQQEPLSTIAIKLLIGRRNNIPWAEVPDSEVDGWLQEAARICKFAAPRTQGRELGIKNLSAETLLSLAEEMLLATWDKDFKFSFSQVRRQMVQFLLRFSDRAQARTQPSRPYEEGLFERLKDPVYAAHYTAECIKLGIEARTQSAPRSDFKKDETGQ